MLVHDAALLDDPTLLRGATGALSLAVANARMRAEVQMQVSELAQSRRRIVEAADVQRRMIAQAVLSGPERHMHALTRILDRPALTEDPGVTTQLRMLRAEVETGIAELRQFAHGVRPTALDEAGLAGALPALAEHAPQQTSISVSPERLPPAVEAAVYFVCAEALTNVAKHAHASRVQVTVTMDDGDVVATVSDDGRAGADPNGSGLRGLADRVEALGGSLRIRRRVEGGTAVEARIPARQVAAP
jgi:signal transduction histidine kinase